MEFVLVIISYNTYADTHTLFIMYVRQSERIYSSFETHTMITITIQTINILEYSI